MSVSQITTVDELKQAVQDYLVGRSDLVAQIPLWIQLAEANFNRMIRNRQMETRSTRRLTAGVEYYPLPSDFLMIRNIALSQDPRGTLRFITPQQMEFLYQAHTAGQPEAFTIYDVEFKFAPVPDSGYLVELFYYAKIPPLSTNSTNWLLLTHPDLYLAAVMMQANVFLLDDPDTGDWANLYSAIMTTLEREQWTEQWNASPLTPSLDVWVP